MQQSINRKLSGKKQVTTWPKLEEYWEIKESEHYTLAKLTIKTNCYPFQLFFLNFI